LIRLVYAYNVNVWYGYYIHTIWKFDTVSTNVDTHNVNVWYGILTYQTFALYVYTNRIKCLHCTFILTVSNIYIVVYTNRNKHLHCMYILTVSNVYIVCIYMNDNTPVMEKVMQCSIYREAWYRVIRFLPRYLPMGLYRCGTSGCI
jgi:hypothetical protein